MGGFNAKELFGKKGRKTRGAVHDISSLNSGGYFMPP